MGTRNIEQTKEAKRNYNHPIIDLLLTDDGKPKTKEELMELLNVSTERSVREIIAECSMFYPIIACSNQKGYRRAKDISNLNGAELDKEIEEVEHQINEIKSRITCLKKKLKPLIAWRSVALNKRGQQHEPEEQH